MQHKCNLIIDSCCDLPFEVVDREGVELIRFPYIMSDGEHADDLYQTSSAHDFYQAMRNGEEPTTAQVPVPVFRDAFERAIASGVPTVYLSFSSGLSGSFDAAALVHDQLMAEHPDAELYIVDTCLASVAEALLVYKIGGEYLDATRGYPCTNWVEGVDAQINSKQIDTYHVTDEDIDYTDKWAGNPNGWQNEDDVPMNKPNATILGVPDGLLVQNGQPYEFTGYVDGYDEKIASVEFSLDRGETWTKYDIGDMDRNKMVWWSFTYKPELEGAYCLTVRATTESGMTSFETQTVMFNAKDKMPNPEDTTVLESASLIPPKVAAASDEKSE